MLMRLSQFDSESACFELSYTYSWNASPCISFHCEILIEIFLVHCPSPIYPSIYQSKIWSWV